MFKYTALITRVVDGDTFDAEIDLGFSITHRIRIRLAEVDTPETYRPKTLMEKAHGLEATSFVAGLIEGKVVVIETEKKGKYGRYLAVIYVEDSDGTVNSLAQLLEDNDLLKRDNYTD